jgi:TonB family protein
MSAYANSLQKPQRFDMYVRKLQSICVMHGVHIGSHRDLPDFLEQLVEDKHLAMDFWAFIGRLSHREGGELTDDQTLAVVIESITDSDVWQEDAGLSRTIDRLRALLAGVDIHAGEQAEPKIAPFPRDKGAPPNDPSLWTHDDASSLRPPDSEAVFPHGQVDENPDPIAAPSATHAPRLEEELLRIELTRLLRQYFDDVAKKMSKGEPHHESATSMGTIASAMTRRSLEEPASEEMEEQRRRLTSRLVLEPQSFIEDTPEAQARTLPVRTPRKREPQLEGYGHSVGILLLAAWLIGAVFAIYPYHRPLQKGLRAWFNRQLQPNPEADSVNLGPQPQPADEDQDDSGARTTQSAGANLPRQPAPQDATARSSNGAPSGLSTGVSTPPSSSVSASSRRSNSTRPSRSAPTYAAPIAKPHASTSRSFNSATSRNAAVDRPIIQSDETPASNLSSADATRIIQVDASVMKANLVASWVPIYPEAAKQNRVAGHVVMQAIIAKDGTVRSLHVTEGDSRLRAAAVEAVYRWRYKPYVVDGQPVEVATTITVEMSPN